MPASSAAQHGPLSVRSLGELRRSCLSGSFSKRSERPRHFVRPPRHQKHISSPVLPTPPTPLPSWASRHRPRPLPRLLGAPGERTTGPPPAPAANDTRVPPCAAPPHGQHLGQLEPATAAEFAHRHPRCVRRRGGWCCIPRLQGSTACVPGASLHALNSDSATPNPFHACCSLHRGERCVKCGLAGCYKCR